jgi:hypothetical protein
VEIPELAQALNQACSKFDIGRLQELRVRLRSLDRAAASAIFDARTIHPDYAFHVGGRTELQFNIGEEDRNGRRVIRHGVAFSLELSQSLPSIDPLLPKIERFNDYVCAHPEDFPRLRMWHHTPQGRHAEHNVAPITDEIIKPGAFIMLGRWVPNTEVSTEDILLDFDRLLPLYAYVESDHSLKVNSSATSFRAGCPDFVLATTVSIQAQTIDVALRHKALQRVLFDCLCAESGSENVSIEHKLELGVSVDAAVRSTNGLSFYELKIAPSVQACVRAAIGQLLEYTYWPSTERARELIVVGESWPDEDAVAYLELLRERFLLPLWYRQIAPNQGLGPRT